MGRRRLPARVVEVPREDLAEVGFPGVSRLRIPLGGARRGHVFVVSRSARDSMDDLRFRTMAQQLGNLVHPAQAVLVVLPDDRTDLRSFEVEVTR